MERLTALLFGGAGGASAAADAGLLVLRVFSGLAMALTHGIAKLPPKPGFIQGVAGIGFPLPELFAWAAGLAEFGGGLLLAVGLLTRPAAAALLFTMLVAAFGLHGTDPFQDKELALLYGSAYLLFLVVGPGRFALDALLRRNAGAAVQNQELGVK